jgi:hypothetical protein
MHGIVFEIAFGLDGKISSSRLINQVTSLAQPIIIISGLESQLLVNGALG